MVSATHAAASFTSTFFGKSLAERERDKPSWFLFGFYPLDRKVMWQQTGRCLHIIMLMRSPSCWKKQKKIKKKKNKRGLKSLTPSGHGYRQSELLGEAAVSGRGLRSGWRRRWWWWHGGRIGAASSQRLSLQRHHHVTAQLLRQRGAVLDVVQAVHLPLVFDT